MSGTYLTWLADELRLAGCHVVEYPDWQTRARSSGGYGSGRPLCVMWHHTASNTAPQNDADYMCRNADTRPIANLMVDRTGAVWVLAAGCTNTNGTGRSRTFSRGTVPADSMNSYAVGIELCNLGDGEPYPQAQIDAAFKASNRVNGRAGNQPGDVCTHQDYAVDRKVDPARNTSVQGSWQPRSVTSSGSWHCDDLKVECERRALTPSEGGDMAAAVCSWGPGRYDVFVTGNDRALWHRWYDQNSMSAWSRWESLGGTLVGPPAASTWGDRRLDVFGVGTDDNLWTIWYDQSKWSKWTSLGPVPG